MQEGRKAAANDAQLSLAIRGLMLGGGEDSPPLAEEDPTRVIPRRVPTVLERISSELRPRTE